MEKDALPYTISHISVSNIPHYGLLWARTVTALLASCVLMCVILLCMHIYFIREIPDMQNKIAYLTEHSHYVSQTHLSAMSIMDLFRFYQIDINIVFVNLKYLITDLAI